MYSNIGWAIAFLIILFEIGRSFRPLLTEWKGRNASEKSVAPHQRRASKAWSVLPKSLTDAGWMADAETENFIMLHRKVSDGSLISLCDIEDIEIAGSFVQMSSLGDGAFQSILIRKRKAPKTAMSKSADKGAHIPLNPNPGRNASLKFPSKS